MVERSGLTIERITRLAGYKRGTYYLHIKRKDLPFSILRKYGMAMSHDFIDEFPEMASYMALEEPNYGTQALTISDAVRERDEWREKYYSLLEKYLLLVEREEKG